VSHRAHERKLDDGRVGVRGAEAAPRRGVSQAGAAKRKRDLRGTFDAGPRSRDDFDSTKYTVSQVARFIKGKIHLQVANECRAASATLTAASSGPIPKAPGSAGGILTYFSAQNTVWLGRIARYAEQLQGRTETELTLAPSSIHSCGWFEHGVDTRLDLLDLVGPLRDQSRHGGRSAGRG
jgi:hypothetical protein